MESETAVCDPVRMEVLADARDEYRLRRLHGLLARATHFPTNPADYDEAAALYRACRREGETVRRLIDCLIGSVAIRTGAAVLHSASDFAGLRIDSVA